MPAHCCNNIGWQCSWVLLLPGLGFGIITTLLEMARLRPFIEENIICYLIFRATRMENITSSIYDVISKGKVASAFSYYKQKFCFLFLSSLSLIYQKLLANLQPSRSLKTYSRLYLAGGVVVVLVLVLLQKRRRNDRYSFNS